MRVCTQEPGAQRCEGREDACKHSTESWQGGREHGQLGEEFQLFRQLRFIRQN